MSELVSPRVNSARLVNHVGVHVRLPCKVIRFTDNAAIVEASDGGQVEVRVPSSTQKNTINDLYVEVIGQVLEPGVIKLLNCINLGDKLDMSIVNFVIDKWHSEQFSSMF